MSLILEALRKSEAERRRGQAPDVAMELPPAALARARNTPAWVVPAAVFVVVVALVVAWWSQRDEPGPAVPEPVASVAAIPQDESPAQPAVVARKPLPSLPPMPATAFPEPPPAPNEPVVLDEPRALDLAPPPGQPLPAAPVPTPDVAATGLPTVKLSMHMWNESPASRFVILNGQRMGEGDRNGDITVVAIERDGVIVERNGQRARVALP